MIWKTLSWHRWKDLVLKSTEHRQAEYELRQSQARYRTVVDTAFDAIITITPDAIVRSFNHGAERIFGYGAEEVIGRPVTLLMPERYRDLCAAGLQRYLETGEARVIGGTTELVGLRNDGSEFPIELSLGEMHEGEERLFTGIIRDISERKQIESALQRSEANLAAAQRMARLGSWESNLEKGEVYWSDELYRVFGFRPQEFVPTYERIINAVHPEDKELVERAVCQALDEGKRFDVEFRAILPDGSERIVHSRAEVVLDEASRPVRMLGTAHDVTERKRAEKALQESEKRFRSLVQHASDIITILETDGTVRYVSPAVERITGHHPEEQIGTNAFDQVHADDREQALRIFAEVLKKPGLHPPVEFRVPHKEGSWRHLEHVVSNLLDDPSIRGVVVNSRDITERKRAEEARRESEERFRALIQNTLDLVMVTEAEGTIQYISPSVEQVLGYRPEEMIGTNTAEYVHPDDLEKGFSELAEALSKPGVHPVAMETRVRHKDGSWRWLEGIANNLLDNPSIGGVVFNHRDVTERKRAEEEIRRLNESLEERIVKRTAQLAASEQRLKELVGKLITAQEEERRRVAYEVHDSLIQMAIATQRYIETFADAHPPGSEVRPGELDRPIELLRQVVQEARRVVSGLRPTTLDDFGLATAVRRRVEELQDEGWQIGYEETLGEERLPTAVETTLYRVTQEALNNVRKHARTTKARVTLRRRGRKVRLEVRDEGRGFDPWAASGEDGPVERVGLSSMRERVALLGGELEIRSKPGAGTLVMVEVPLPARFEGRGADHEG